jgi:hypothetical protein
MLNYLLVMEIVVVDDFEDGNDDDDDVKHQNEINHFDDDVNDE